MPVTENFIQKLRQQSVTLGGYKITNTASYLQNYDHSMLIERINVV